MSYILKEQDGGGSDFPFLSDTALGKRRGGGVDRAKLKVIRRVVRPTTTIDCVGYVVD